MKRMPQYLMGIFAPGQSKPDWHQKELQLKSFLKEHPEDEEAILHQLSIVLGFQDKHDECIQVCERMLELNPEDDMKEEVYIGLARSYSEKKDLRKQEECYSKALELDPECEEAATELGKLYALKQHWDKAQSYYNLLIESDSEFVKAEGLHLSGAMHFRRQAFDKAQDYFEQGLELDPEDARFPHGIGICYAGKEEWETAMEWFNKELEVDPQSADAYYSLGLTWQHRQDFYRAMHNYMEALKIKPDYPEVYNNIAKLFLEHEGDIKKAIEMLRKSIETAPDEKVRGMFYLNLSRVYKTIADYDLEEEYKAKFLESLGFEVEWEDDNDDDDKEPT